MSSRQLRVGLLSFGPWRFEVLIKRQGAGRLFSIQRQSLLFLRKPLLPTNPMVWLNYSKKLRHGRWQGMSLPG